ncbi:GNAT family N-acetyltransferase [Metabacillus sp. 84]|uniref:GNAT family N-acetyltransferase n=1 Tax=Metabacillus sp. 84 TaxID=3404705 RepID=UPI003CF7E433
MTRCDNREISFRPVEYERDFQRIFKWMHKEHVIPYWKLNMPEEDFRKHLQQALSDSHQTLSIGMLNGEPVSYWETYWVKGDAVGKTYEYEEWDQGVHLLIGEEKYLGKGLALPMLRAAAARLLEVPETGKIIAEPDIRNEKMIHIFEKCGFEAVGPIQLPDKTGLLMFCSREEFERRWNHVKA